MFLLLPLRADAILANVFVSFDGFSNFGVAGLVLGVPDSSLDNEWVFLQQNVLVLVVLHLRDLQVFSQSV